jgi:hypothetical protein
MQETIVRKGNQHTVEEDLWAKSKIDAGLISQKMIAQNNLTEQYFVLFRKRLTVAGLYSWFRLVKNPELRKMKHEYYKNRIAKKGNNGNANVAFTKSNYLLYTDNNVVGFESLTEIKPYLTDNKIIAGEISVFKKVPAKIEYSVVIDG